MDMRCRLECRTAVFSLTVCPPACLPVCMTDCMTELSILCNNFISGKECCYKSPSSVSSTLPFLLPRKVSYIQCVLPTLIFRLISFAQVSQESCAAALEARRSRSVCLTIGRCCQANRWTHHPSLAPLLPRCASAKVWLRLCQALKTTWTNSEQQI